MQGIKRKLVYVALYESIGLTVVSATLLILGHSLTHAGIASVVISILAVSWNLLWNTLFERWEAKQADPIRTVSRRIAHATGFEIGLVVAIVPPLAWWLQISLWEALVMDLGLVVFFLIYTYIFTLGFDTVFGLPSAAENTN